jgi:multidrug efflux pump subunit AcrA (membrane-fusion protein)
MAEMSNLTRGHLANVGRGTGDVAQPPSSARCRAGACGRRAIAQSQTQKAAMALGVTRSGVVQSIDGADGAHVAAGQVLAELDSKPLRKEIDVRAASLIATWE